MLPLLSAGSPSGISMLEVVASRVVAYSTINAEKETIIGGSAHHD